MYTFRHLNDNVYADHKQWKNDMFYACPERDCMFYKGGCYICSYAYTASSNLPTAANKSALNINDPI